MARCKGCIHDKVCNRDVGHGYSICPHYINTAEVVPKSEVAREIFAEIYKSVASKIPMQILPIFKDDLGFDDGFINGKRDALLDVLVIIAELKKKYTEGET